MQGILLNQGGIGLFGSGCAFGTRGQMIGRQSQLHPAALHRATKQGHQQPSGLASSSSVVYNWVRAAEAKPPVRPTGSLQCLGLAPDFFDKTPRLPPWPQPQRCPGGLEIFPIAAGLSADKQISKRTILGVFKPCSMASSGHR